MLKVTRPISKKKPSSHPNNLFITMDIETISQVVNNNNSILIPYLICWYDGKRDIKHSYLIENGNIKNTISNIMRDICIRKYKNYKIYMHNFSKFDALFLIKYLVEIGKTKPIIHKGKIISFKFSPNWKKDFGYITFMDSYLLIPSSLKNLCKSFLVKDPKGIFPYKLYDINYSSNIVPDFKYFNNITMDDYNKYKDNFINKIWDFKQEAIKYCELDCISLYQVINKFNILIFNKFKLNIINHPT